MGRGRGGGDPCGPYADRFLERQHTYGPFGAIDAKVKALRVEGK